MVQPVTWSSPDGWCTSFSNVIVWKVFLLREQGPGFPLILLRAVPLLTERLLERILSHHRDVAQERLGGGGERKP